MIGKCVELFRDMLAPTRHVAVLTNAADPLFAKLVLDEAERAGRITGIKIQPIMVRGPDEELDAAFAAIVRERADAVVIQGSLSTKRMAELAVAHRLPAASTTRGLCGRRRRRSRFVSAEREVRAEDRPARSRRRRQSYIALIRDWSRAAG
jgi:hypothetical protein